MATAGSSKFEFASSNFDASSVLVTDVRTESVGNETRRNVPKYVPPHSLRGGVCELDHGYFGDDDGLGESPTKLVKAEKKKRLVKCKIRKSGKYCTVTNFTDSLAYFENLSATFHRRMLCFRSYDLLKNTICHGFNEMLKSMKSDLFWSNVSYRDLKIYQISDSLFEIYWVDCPLDRVYSLDFQKKVVVLLDGSTVDPGMTNTYDVLPDDSNKDKFQHTSLGLKFSEFQYMMYKLILPTGTNKIYEAFGNGRGHEEYVADCKFSNNFIFEYASAPARYTMGLATLGYGSLHPVTLDLDQGELSSVLEFTLPLYGALLIQLHNTMSLITSNVTLLPISDYVRVRLAFELTAHVYWEAMKLRGIYPRKSVMQDLTSSLHLAVSSVIQQEPKKKYFINLREDHRGLALLQCVFAQIRFSHTLRNYFESVW